MVLGSGVGPANAATTFVEAGGRLTDLQPGTANATDGASADVWAFAAGGHTTFVAVFRGLDSASVGNTFGVHVHVGTCVAGNGMAAGPHYNSGGPSGPVSARTEVWLDFRVRPGGYGFATTTVPFTIEPGDANSIVVHADPTTPSGAAGARQACLPIDF